VASSGWELIRLFLHITAATIWVGGQLVLAALVPSLRGISPQAPAIAARAFARIAWPAFAVLIVTGAWNAWAVRDDLHDSYAVLFASKLVVVALSGLTAWLHARATTPAARGGFGAATAAFALLAVLLGVQLTL
jgi:putative copper export protein